MNLQRFKLFQKKGQTNKQTSPTPSFSLPSTVRTLDPKYTLPPVPHPCPHEYIALRPTSAGLVLRPRSGADQVILSWSNPPAIATHEPQDQASDDKKWLDALVVYGIVGILNLAKTSYLLVITQRTEVGHIFDLNHGVYCVKSIAAIPLKEERARPILNTLFAKHAGPSLFKAASPPVTPAPLSVAQERAVKFADSDDVTLLTPREEIENDSHSVESVSTRASSTDSLPITSPSKALADKFSFWSLLSQRDKNHSKEALHTLDQADDPEQLADLAADTAINDSIAAHAPPPTSEDQRAEELEAKIVRETIKEFSKPRGMYFAYTFDISRSLQHKQELVLKARRNVYRRTSSYSGKATKDGEIPEKDQFVDPLPEPSPTLPLWRRCDQQFIWNEWLSKPFADAGFHSYVLPLMQGYVQITAFRIMQNSELDDAASLPPVEYTVISRRSKHRAGLRFQRRGVDDDAFTANFVETECITRIEKDSGVNIFSYVQIRGSVPLFWNQSGTNLKPPPVLSSDRTHAQNADAMRRHFAKTIPQYGPLNIINLAEQHGKEAALVQAYKQYVSELDVKDVIYNDYDFHVETKGMKYENIQKLLDRMERVTEHQGYFWISDNVLMSEQKGVYRINCIDCLDRTNVVQSAFARHVLKRQLAVMAVLPPPFIELEPTPTHLQLTEMDIVFNDAWANNGDAISRAYAGTSALKGDFTRTGKRDLTGMLNDGVNSIARMYSSTFSDWFSQAVIDFMLGNRNLTVFSEFLLKLQSTDPGELLRLSKIRAEAVVTCVSRVLPEGEALLNSGWTFISPETLNTKISEKFEEKILLLTASAFYIISYDYTLEKVNLYTRIPLTDIVKLTKGPYILSPLEDSSRDPIQNHGFQITWRNTNQTTRVSSYSFHNEAASSPASSPTASVFANTRPTPQPENAKKIPSLARLLSTVAAPTAAVDSGENFAVFKSLPVDPQRPRPDAESEPAIDELEHAASCREKVQIVVDVLAKACEEARGTTRLDFVEERDIISLLEAQKATTAIAKLEYGFKRLLWLGPA